MPSPAHSLSQGEDPAHARLVELLSDWTWEQDAEFRFTAISPGNGAASAFPYVGRKAWEQPALNVTEEDWERHRAQLAWHQPFRDFELQQASEDGRVVWIALSGVPVFDASGVFKGYRGIGRDITQQKRAGQLRDLEHSVARCLTHAATTSEGLRGGLQAICEAEAWDAGRCFRVAPGGELALEDAWFAREMPIERLLQTTRVRWEAGKTVWSTEVPRTKGPATPPPRDARYAAFTIPVVVQDRTVALLAFSGHTWREPDESFVAAAPAIGSLFGQFLKRRDAEESLRDSEARFRSLTHLSSDFFWESDAQHRLATIVHGPGYPAVPVGYAALGKAPWDMPSSAPDEAGWKLHRAIIDSRLPFRDFEIARPLPDGAMRHFAVSGEPRYDSHGTFLGYRGVGRDVSEIAAARERISSLAYSDPLTGLANRLSLSPALELAIERSRRHGWKIAGVFVDLDGFKQINDRHGHAAGDAYLVEVAQRLRRSVRASDLVARLGGDEFFLALEEVHDMPAVEKVLSKLIDALRRPYAGIGDAQRRISATLGVSLFPDDAEDAETLMRHADQAMYAAKQAGKNAYCLYSNLAEKPAPTGP